MKQHKLNKSVKGAYYLLIGPYHEPLLEAIRGMPTHARMWDGTLKAWKIADSFHEQALAIIDEHSPEVT